MGLLQVIKELILIVVIPGIVLLAIYGINSIRYDKKTAKERFKKSRFDRLSILLLIIILGYLVGLIAEALNIPLPF